MTNDPILDDLRAGLRRRAERRRRVRAAVAGTAASLVIAATALTALERPAGTSAGVSPTAAPATFTPISTGKCFTTLRACGLSGSRI